MKYTIQFLDKIENVKQFLIVEGVLFLLSEHKLRIIDEILETKIIDFKSDSIYEVDKNIFSARDFYYDTNLKKIIVLEKIKNYYFTNDFYGDNLLFSNLDMVLYSLREQKIITYIPFNEDYGIHKVLDNKFIGRGDDFYNLCTFNNQLLWQHSFSELFETEQGAEFIFQNGEIIIHNGKLFFSLFENNRHYNTATFAIEIETGKVVNMYKGFAGNLTLFNNKIAVITNDELRVLNLDNNEITSRTFSFLKEKNIAIGWNDFQISEDEKLYFIGSDHRQGAHFGIIDLQKDELLWLHSPNKNDKLYKVSIRDFKISDNRVFLHYSDNTLHIFEEEK